MSIYKITSKIDFATIQKIISEKQKIALSDESRKKIIKCRAYLDKKIKSSKESIYGINTGFGALYNKSISEKDLGKLQENLVMSHACGVARRYRMKL